MDRPLVTKASLELGVLLAAALCLFVIDEHRDRIRRGLRRRRDG
ncbi:MAG TPA: hypothetical protein VE198_24735 [Actinoallomurus sp.]|jgi:hypothetical protein|nr:hypothetical protein [Actinoallomurus sp.]